MLEWCSISLFFRLNLNQNQNQNQNFSYFRLSFFRGDILQIVAFEIILSSDMNRVNE